MIKGRDNLKFNILILSIIFFIVLMPFVSSAPSKFSGASTIGIDIEHPTFDTYPFGKDLRFQFHIYNVSNGKPLVSNSSVVTCAFHLYNSTGSHLLENNYLISGDNVLDYSIKVTKGNFSYIGQYAYVFACNSSAEGGFFANTFDINTDGRALTSGMGLIYFLVTLFAFGIFLMVGWIFININGENPQDQTGYLGINYRKYIKCALFPLVYVTFVWFFNFIIGLSVNYLGLTLYANVLGFMFSILSKGIYPMLVITLIVAIVLMIKDANIEKEYKSLWSQF